MKPYHLLTLVLSALRSVRYLLDGNVRFPRDRLGDVLERPDGETFIVYRETALTRGIDPSEEHVVLVFGMHVKGREASETVRGVLFDPLANVATPFFSGMPGFRRKLWLAGQRPGEFLELYEWASREDADRFVEVLDALLAPFDFAGSASFEVVDDDSIDEYVDARAVQWRDATSQSRPRPSISSLLAVLGAVAAVGYHLWTRRARDISTSSGIEIEIDVEGA